MVRFKGDVGHLLDALNRLTFGFNTFGIRTAGIFSALKIAAPVAAAAIAGAFAGSAVKSFASFDKAMTGSLAIMGNVSDAMRRSMEKTALDLSRKVTFSATELAGAYYELASAGMNAAQAQKALPIVAQFAQAGLINVSQATEYLVTALNGLGLASKDPIKNMENLKMLSDQITTANNNAVGSLEDYGKGLQVSAGALRMWHQSSETGLAALMAFAQGGIFAQNAGTNLSIVLRDLITKAEKNSEAFETFGINVFDANGKVRNLALIVQDVEHALEGYTDEQKKAALAMLGFSDRSVQALLRLVGFSDEMLEWQRIMGDAGDATEEVANNQLKSFSAQLQLMKNNVNTFMIEVGRKLTPVLLQALNGISNWFDTHGPKLGQMWRDATPHLLAFTRGVQVVGQAIYDGLAWIIAHKPALIASIAAIAGAFLFFTGPIGVIMSVAAAIIYLIGTLKNLGISIDNTKLALAGLALTVAGAMMLIGGPIGWLLGALIVVVTALNTFEGSWTEIFDSLPRPVQNAMIAAAGYLDAFAQKLADFRNWLGGELNGLLNDLNENLFKASGIPAIGKLFGQDWKVPDVAPFKTDYQPKYNMADALREQQQWDQYFDTQEKQRRAQANHGLGNAGIIPVSNVRALREEMEKLGLNTLDVDKLLNDFGNKTLPDLGDEADKAGKKIERSLRMQELAKAFIYGGDEMVAKLREFHEVSDALWPQVVAAAAAAGIQLTEDDRAMWEARLNNGQGFLDEMIAQEEAATARRKQLMDEVKEAWIVGGDFMAAQVRANAIMMDGMWAEQVAKARESGLELTEEDRKVWEARLNNGQRYVDKLIAEEERLAERRKKLNQELLDAFIRGGQQMVDDARRVQAWLDAEWEKFVAAAKAANLEVTEADREMWEQRMLNASSAVDYLIAKEKELAEAREKAHDDAVAAVDQLGSLLETALQRQHDAQVKAERARAQAVIDGLERQKDAAEAASRARIDVLEREKDAAIRASEEMTRRLIAPIQAQIDALEDAEVVEQFEDIAKQMLITYDPREMDKLLKQRRKLERDQLKKSLQDQIDNLEDRGKADRDAIEERYERQRDAEEAALQTTIANLDAQIEAARAAYDAISDDFDVQSEVRKLLMSGEVEKMAALLDEFVPEWRTAGLSYGQQLIDGIKASGAEEYIRGVLAQVSAVNSATAAASNNTQVIGYTPSGQPITMADKIADQMAIKRLVDGGAPQAAIDAQRASYLQIYGEPSPYRYGGVFTRPGIGLFGEYANARTDPEVASPVSIMQQAFAEVLEKYVGAMGQGCQVVIYIDGKKLDERIDYTFKRLQRQAPREARLSGINV